MTKIKKLLFCITSAGMLLTASAFSQGISNLDQSDLGMGNIKYGYWQAIKFTTGNSSPTFDLSSITLQLGAHQGDPTGFFVQLYSDLDDTGGSTGTFIPGSSLGLTLVPAGGVPGAAGNYSFSPSSSFSLTADTSYWVVLGATVDNSSLYPDPASDPNFDQWVYPPTGETDDSGWSIANTYAESFDQGGSWTPHDGDGAYKVAIAVPEPATNVMLLFGVGFLFLRIRKSLSI